MVYIENTNSRWCLKSIIRTKDKASGSFLVCTLENDKEK